MKASFLVTKDKNIEIIVDIKRIVIDSNMGYYIYFKKYDMNRFLNELEYTLIEICEE